MLSPSQGSRLSREGAKVPTLFKTSTNIPIIAGSTRFSNFETGVRGNLPGLVQDAWAERVSACLVACFWGSRRTTMMHAMRRAMKSGLACAGLVGLAVALSAANSSCAGAELANLQLFRGWFQRLISGAAGGAKKNVAAARAPLNCAPISGRMAKWRCLSGFAITESRPRARSRRRCCKEPRTGPSKNV